MGCMNHSCSKCGKVWINNEFYDFCEVCGVKSQVSSDECYLVEYDSNEKEEEENYED